VTCAVCHRQARGFGAFNPRLKRGDPHRHPHRWVFCSRRCQVAFTRILDKTEGQMIDSTELERAAMEAALTPLGDYVASIGMQRPLADYSRAEVLTLIEVAVTAYQDHMVEAHERRAERDRAYFEAQLNRPATPAGSEVPF
jgi:hypothetical protein